MKTYQIRFEADDTGATRTIEFDGESPHGVFDILKDEAPDQAITLWEGDRCIAHLELDRNGVWSLR